MTLLEAIAAMREGMLVRREDQEISVFYGIHNNEVYLIDLITPMVKLVGFRLSAVEATNWKIVAKPFKES
jgi:hypothetical protein